MEMRPRSEEVIQTAEEYLRKAREAVDKALMEEKRRLFVSACVCLSSMNLDEGGYDSHRKVVDAIMNGQPLFKFKFGGFGERLVYAACCNEDLFFVHRPGDLYDRYTYEPGNFWHRNKLFRVNSGSRWSSGTKMCGTRFPPQKGSKPARMKSSIICMAAAENFSTFTEVDAAFETSTFSRSSGQR